MEKSQREGGLAPAGCRKLFTNNFHAGGDAAIRPSGQGIF